MNKLLLVAALVICFSLPASAAGEKSQARPKHQYVEPSAADQLKSEKTTRRKSDRGEVSDPYWTPCNYQSAWECGGE
jgi:hypothetical protein